MQKACTIEFTKTIHVKDPSEHDDARAALPMVVLANGARLSGMLHHCVLELHGRRVECFMIEEASGRVLGPICSKFMKLV